MITINHMSSTREKCFFTYWTSYCSSSESYSGIISWDAPSVKLPTSFYGYCLVAILFLIFSSFF